MRTQSLVATFLLAAIAFAAVLAYPAGPARADTAPRAACGPEVTLTPNFGQAGSQVSVNIRHYPANSDFTVILRIAGDPVLGTGRTDSEGRANFVFTMPAFTGDYVNVFVTSLPCNSTGAHFFYKATTPSPVPPTRTPTPPPASTPTPVVGATVTATPPPPVVVTPAPPVAGSGSGAFGTAGGFNVALVALALIVFSSGFALLGSSRRRRATVLAESFALREASGLRPRDED